MPPPRCADTDDMQTMLPLCSCIAGSTACDMYGVRTLDIGGKDFDAIVDVNLRGRRESGRARSRQSDGA